MNIFVETTEEKDWSQIVRRLTTTSNINKDINDKQLPLLCQVQQQQPHQLPSHSALTAHDEYVLWSLQKTLHNHLEWTKYLPSSVSEDEIMTAYRVQYENSIARHVCGIQPMCGPTGLVFAAGRSAVVEEGEWLHDTLFCRNTDFHSFFGNEMEMPPIREEYVPIITKFGRGASIEVCKQFSRFMEVGMFSICACSRALEHRNDLASELDHEIVRTLRYIAKPAVSIWNLPFTHAIVHPTKAAWMKKWVKTLVGDEAMVLVSESVTVDEVILVRKTNNFDAPLFYMPYVVPLQEKNTKHRYGLGVNPYTKEKPDIRAVEGTAENVWVVSLETSLLN